jgi:hypothetical protein
MFVHGLGSPSALKFYVGGVEPLRFATRSLFSCVLIFYHM